MRFSVYIPLLDLFLKMRLCENTQNLSIHEKNISSDSSHHFEHVSDIFVSYHRVIVGNVPKRGFRFDATVASTYAPRFSIFGIMFATDISATCHPMTFGRVT